MTADSVYESIEKIQQLVEKHTDEDGTLQFDGLKIMVALDFVKTELEKSIEKGRT